VLDSAVASKKILEAFGLEEDSKRACSFAFSSRSVPSHWKAFNFDLPWEFYYVLAEDGNLSRIKSLVSGIGKENFALVAVLRDYVVLALRRFKKEDKSPLVIAVRKEEDLERVTNAVRKFNFSSDVLTAHASLSSVVGLLKVGAERHFINRGLFSTYFLKERLSKCLSKRGRSVPKESSDFLKQFGGEFPAKSEKAVSVLEALGFGVEAVSKSGYPEYLLRLHGRQLDASCVVVDAESLDIKTGDKVAPSYQAVSALRSSTWVVLTNGRLWRLYSSRISSSSTNYFEVDLEGVVADSDPRLVYFVSLFSSSSMVVKQDISDVDLVFDEGIRHAKGVEDDLRKKVFDGVLFLNLVRSVLVHSGSKKYSQEELDNAKGLALKLLYRLLFVLYAESRGLLPTQNEKYSEYSLEALRPRLGAFEKKPADTSVWKVLKTLFSSISNGDADANLPQYDGALFEEDSVLDKLKVKNAFLVPALQDLMESDGKGIDYQNLGVRHLGSLYEALLEYSVRQAQQSLVIYKKEILDAKYAEDLKQKPMGFVEEGELYLSVKGLARKGTGSYYTPDEIVTFLVKKGLEPHFKKREEKFVATLRTLPPESKPRNLKLEKECNDALLGLKVVDPAMGSGHFLVAVVNEVTNWIIALLKEYPEAPLMREIEQSRKSIVEEQRKNRVSLDPDLLTDDIILKRLVMKRCVYGVDINPLAVELAKLSLWLDSFTIGTPLTFLDHHIRCGDSLIGLWMKNIESKVFETTLERWTGTVSSAGENLVESVIVSGDLTFEQVAQSREAYEEYRQKTKSLRVLLDMFCANVIDPKLGAKLPKNLSLIEAIYKKKGEKPKWWNLIDTTLSLSENYRFFHWELEFPDAFTLESRGFDLVVMNPPWDIVRFEDDDFFSIYYPRFRRIARKTEKRKAIRELLKNTTIKNRYHQNKNVIDKKLMFYKSKEYMKRGRGDINLWKLFLERSMKLLSEGGNLSLVLPSSIVTHAGAKGLREALFKGRIRTLYEFENKRGIFPDVHRSIKFVLLVWDNIKPEVELPAAFYLHSIDAIYGKTEQEKFLKIPLTLVKKCSPDTLSIPELRNEKQLEIFQKIYKDFPLLDDESKSWKVSLIREFDKTFDSDLFRNDGRGWPLIEGKNIHQFLPDYEKPLFSVDPTLGLQRVSRRKEYGGINKEIHKTVRLVYRRIASSTNVRTMIACIIPPETFCTYNAVVILPVINKKVPKKNEYFRLLSYLVGVLNSFVFDFLVRSRVGTDLNFFFIYKTPIPSDFKHALANRIIEIATRLSSHDERFNAFSEFLFSSTKTLDVRESIELTAELNALVAHHYRLTREELGVILESFEGLKENNELLNMKEVKWNNKLISQFNGEVRKRVLPYFDSINSGQTEGEKREERDCR
jgi:hypothetical protein